MICQPTFRHNLIKRHQHWTGWRGSGLDTGLHIGHGWQLGPRPRRHAKRGTFIFSVGHFLDYLDFNIQHAAGANKSQLMQPLMGRFPILGNEPCTSDCEPLPPACCWTLNNWIPPPATGSVGCHYVIGKWWRSAVTRTAHWEMIDTRLQLECILIEVIM